MREPSANDTNLFLVFIGPMDTQSAQLGHANLSDLIGQTEASISQMRLGLVTHTQINKTRKLATAKEKLITQKGQRLQCTRYPIQVNNIGLNSPFVK